MRVNIRQATKSVKGYGHLAVWAASLSGLGLREKACGTWGLETPGSPQFLNSWIKVPHKKTETHEPHLAQPALWSSYK